MTDKEKEFVESRIKLYRSYCSDCILDAKHTHPDYKDTRAYYYDCARFYEERAETLESLLEDLSFLQS